METIFMFDRFCVQIGERDYEWIMLPKLHASIDDAVNHLIKNPPDRDWEFAEIYRINLSTQTIESVRFIKFEEYQEAVKRGE